MKRKYAFIYIIALLIMTGCGGKTVPNTTDTSSSVIETTGTVSTTAEKTTQASTTAAVTTSKDPQPPKELILKGSDIVEVYDEITLGDYFTEKNVDLKDPAELLDTNDLGQHEVTVKYIYEGNEFETKIRYNVADTTAPLLLNAGWSPYHKRGTAFDLNEYVGYADNYDKYPTLSYTGEVDPNTSGIYPLTATATDSSGNQTTWDVSILVVDDVPFPEDDNPRVDYSDFITRYDEGNVRFGIDVSTWQGNIDFNAVRDAGCSFVIMRIGYYYSQITMDDYFQANLAGATAAGLDVGIYYYTTDRTVEGVKEHAKWIADQLNGQQLDFPIAFDWEEFSTFQEYGMSIHDLNELYQVFADEMESYGYSAMLYSSRNFLQNFWTEKSKSSHPVWLAHFTDQTDYEGEYAIWQASAYGNIPGIYGDVDMNIQYLDIPIY